MAKKLHKAAKLASDLGWDLNHRGRHIKATKNGHVVFLPHTPSCYRGEKNAMSVLRRCERGQCQCAGVRIEVGNVREVYGAC